MSSSVGAAAGEEEGSGRGACVLTGALSPQGTEHAVRPGQGRRHGRPAALAVPLVLVLAGPVGTGGGAARGLCELGLAAVAGAPRAAGRAAAARTAAAGRAEDEDGAEEALQGLLLRLAARAALRVLQKQPPAQAAQGVAPAGAPQGTELAPCSAVGPTALRWPAVTGSWQLGTRVAKSCARQCFIFGTPRARCDLDGPCRNFRPWMRRTEVGNNRFQDLLSSS